MPKQKPMRITPMARAFFRHYEHKHQLMKQYLDKDVQPPERTSDFSTGFSSDFV